MSTSTRHRWDPPPRHSDPKTYHIIDIVSVPRAKTCGNTGNTNSGPSKSGTCQRSDLRPLFRPPQRLASTTQPPSPHPSQQWPTQSLSRKPPSCRTSRAAAMRARCALMPVLQWDGHVIAGWLQGRAVFVCGSAYQSASGSNTSALRTQSLNPVHAPGDGRHRRLERHRRGLRARACPARAAAHVDAAAPRAARPF